MNNDFEPIQYEDTLHAQFQEKRRQIAERINTAITQNQDCYIAYWVKQNLDKNLDDYTLVHGFKGEYYTFSFTLIPAKKFTNSWLHFHTLKFLKNSNHKTKNVNTIPAPKPQIKLNINYPL